MHIRALLRRYRERPLGQSLTEFALLLPVFLVVLSAAIDNTVTVTATGRFNLLTPVMGLFFGGQTITFSSTATNQISAFPPLPNETPDPTAAPTAAPSASGSASPPPPPPPSPPPPGCATATPAFSHP